MTDGIPPCYNTRLVQQKSSQDTLDEMEENTTSLLRSRISEGAGRSREHLPVDQTTALLARLIEMQIADMKRRDDEAATRQMALMEALAETKEATKRESERKATEENALQDRKEEQYRLEKSDRKRAIIGHQLQKWEDTTDVETYLRTFEEAMVEGEYEKREWLSILQKYLAGKALQTYKEVATLGETTYKEVKEAMLELLGITVQQACKTLWLGKPKPEESPRIYWQPIIQAIAKLKRVITNQEKAAEELFQGALLNAYGKETLLYIRNCNTNSQYQTIEALTELWEAKMQQERRKMLREVSSSNRFGGGIRGWMGDEMASHNHHSHSVRKMSHLYIGVGGNLTGEVGMSGVVGGPLSLTAQAVEGCLSLSVVTTWYVIISRRPDT